MGDVTSSIERLPCAPGSQLPSERTLSADLGVGRTTVRLVLGKLTAAGLIEPQHGGFRPTHRPWAPSADRGSQGFGGAQWA